jgi:hypothetical protein
MSISGGARRHHPYGAALGFYFFRLPLPLCFWARAEPATDFVFDVVRLLRRSEDAFVATRLLVVLLWATFHHLPVPARVFEGLARPVVPGGGALAFRGVTLDRRRGPQNCGSPPSSEGLHMARTEPRPPQLPFLAPLDQLALKFFELVEGRIPTEPQEKLT